jgi:RNA methyltransferase, TrmH family
MGKRYSEPSLITTRNHPAVKRIRALHSRPERDAAGVFVAEGVRFVIQAAEARSRIEELVVAPDLLTSPSARRLAHRLTHSGTRCLHVSSEVFHSLATTDSPQGIAAVVRQEWLRIEEVDPHEGLCWIAVSSVGSLGNLGTLVRTADAVGAAGFVFLDPRPDPYDPACVRATMGAVFGLRFARASLGGLVAWKQRRGAVIVGTSPTAEVDYQEADYSGPTVVFLGDERKGMSEEEQRACDLMVRIPMVGKSDSLNLGVAGSVVLYELFNQRRRRPGGATERDAPAGTPGTCR